jgi:hypothetical protein
MKTISIYIFAWAGMVILAIVNGIVRNHIYSHSMSELAAHQVSTIILMIVLGIYIYVLTGHFRIQSAAEAFTIGGIWLFMTMIFEFVFGHYVAGHPWSVLLQDYNVLNGRVWILVLVWTFVAPFAFYRLRV